MRQLPINPFEVINGRAKKEIPKRGREEDDKSEIYGNVAHGDTLIKIATEEIIDGAKIGFTDPL
ncbi:MAG: hypothetical protein H7122_18555 [Chitinophagaceae bacterium]|nr:hypothetical protein [Chitinophagaceae bacterium]